MKSLYRLASGQGVSSLMLDQSNLKIKEIELKNIIKDKNQVRSKFNDETIKELAQSIDSDGLLQPISVYESKPNSGKYVILAGERRYRACEYLGKDKITSIILEEPEDRKKLLFMQFAENLHREDLDQFDIAKQIKVMRDLGLTQIEIAKGLNKDNSFVSRHLQLLDLPDSVMKLAEKDRASSEALVNLKNAYEINPTATTLYINEVLKDEKGKVTLINSRDFLNQVKESSQLNQQQEPPKPVEIKPKKTTIEPTATADDVDDAETARSIEENDDSINDEQSMNLNSSGQIEKIEPTQETQEIEQADPPVNFFKRIHASKLLIEVEFYSEETDDIIKGHIVTDRVTYDSNYVYVSVEHQNGDIEYNYVKVEDIQLIGCSESNKVLRS